MGRPGGAKPHKNETSRQSVNVYECWIKENYAEEMMAPERTEQQSSTNGVSWFTLEDAFCWTRLQKISSVPTLTPTFDMSTLRPESSGATLWCRDLAPCQQA